MNNKEKAMMSRNTQMQSVQPLNFQPVEFKKEHELGKSPQTKKIKESNQCIPIFTRIHYNSLKSSEATIATLKMKDSESVIVDSVIAKQDFLNSGKAIPLSNLSVQGGFGEFSGIIIQKPN